MHIKPITICCLVIILAAYGYFIFDSRTRTISANDEIDGLKTQLYTEDSQIISLKEKITPTNPTHNLNEISTLPRVFQQKVIHSPSGTPVISTGISLTISQTLLSQTNVNAYWNYDWAGKTYELQQIAEAVNKSYHDSHVYIINETDCIDMAADIWNILLKKGIKSMIAVGNLDNPNATFQQCNHAWIMMADSTGHYIALEATNGQTCYADSPQSDEYGVCFLYAKPTDVHADIGSRW
jgi:hypothetical protein